MSKPEPMSTNARMKLALAKPLSGPRQIRPLRLPTPTMPVREWATVLTAISEDTERDFLLFLLPL